MTAGISPFCHKADQMAEGPEGGEQEPAGRVGWFRPQYFAWVFFIIALIASTPEPNYDLPILLVLLGIFQIVEPRFRLFSSRRGQIASITLKLVFSYLLVGYSHGIESPYHPIFLVPIVSSATTFELTGVIVVTLVASLAYFSFLLPIYIDWSQFELPPDYLNLMSLRISFFAIVAFVVFEQAKAKRSEMERTRQAAAELAKSNRSLRRAEASLRRSERLAALGQLTAGLAHELRNPLGTIKASAEMLTKGATRNRPEVMAEMAGFIRSEADRMSSLITSFLNFARPLQIHPVEADLKPILREVVREQSGLSNASQVRVVADGSEPPLVFNFDPDLIRVALSNLLQNAIQASPAGEGVDISAGANGANVEIRVADRGKGIRPEDRESIFNPFFTTKPQGVGLGLALVSKIVDEHRGRITVQSEPGHGTTFEVTLPKEQET
jgi:two-component system, NtrC family, sensor histidine kinase HydH